MVTPDKDYGQLVEEKIFMYKPSRMGNGVEILGVKEICEKWAINRPEQVIDLLGLMGDKVDNIPGVPRHWALRPPQSSSSSMIIWKICLDIPTK